MFSIPLCSSKRYSSSAFLPVHPSDTTLQQSSSLRGLPEGLNHSSNMGLIHSFIFMFLRLSPGPANFSVEQEGATAMNVGGQTTDRVRV